jgi:hypothetical protein
MTEISSKYDTISLSKETDLYYLTLISHSYRGNISQLTFDKVIKVTIKGLYCHVKYLKGTHVDELKLKISSCDRRKFYEFFTNIMHNKL